MPKLAFSFDPDAGTLYCYFTELEAGQVQYELEYPAALLLDAAGSTLGLRIYLDDEILLDQLDLALELPGVYLNERGHLSISVTDEEPERVARLAQTALLDLDDDGLCLGIEAVVPEELRPQGWLDRLAPLLVALEAMPVTGEGPVVFAPPTVEDEPDPAEATGDAEEAETTAPSIQPAATPTRVGFVALVGKPNVGKSTLLNRLLGQKVAIVSPRPQTTRVPLRGILNQPDAQIIFIDTPGIHDPRHKLGEFMVDLASRAIPSADVVCFMVDAMTPPTQLDRKIAAQVQRARAPKLLLINKIDKKPRPGERIDPQANVMAYRELAPWDMELAISAQRGLGVEALIEELVRRLPEGARLYPEEQVADQSEQHLAAELVREKVLRFTEHEVPHAVAVEVEEWQEKEHATYIRMNINVERETQKGILIGAGGTMLKQIGSAARGDIERMVGRQIFLELWVKVRPNWRDDPSALNWLGYRRKDYR